MTAQVPAHWIRRNETTRHPRRFIWLDTEASETTTPQGWRQIWRMGVTAFDNLDPSLKRPRPTEWATHKTPDELWRWVSAHCQQRGRTVLCAHNLGYDLRIAAAMDHLPALGWELLMIRLDGGQAWARWRRGESSITMVDSMSWLPTGLGKIGNMLGMEKPPLPAAVDSESEWEHRCRSDVEIMRAAMLRVWGWMESADLGVWQMTGAGCAWSAWRHRFLTDKVLASADPEMMERERAAAWSGRCEAWRWGTMPGGPWVELDMEMAYATVAASTAVPVKMVTEIPAGRLRAPRRPWTVSAVLAEVEVTTDLPLVPAQHEGRIVWPVGTFQTVLWSPELRLLDDFGATVRPLRAWGYRAAPALQAWAEWIIPLAQGVGDGADPLIRLVAKQWSRALIGRFGLRYHSWEDAGESAVSDVQLVPGFDTVTNEAYRYLQVGRKVMREGAQVDSPNAVPAVMAYIMSECRARLWRLMMLAGLDNVAYVDTDCLIVNRAGAEGLQRPAPTMPATFLRSKGSHRRLEVLGPRQLVIGGQMKAAGVPKDAIQEWDGRWHATVWRSLAESMRRGDAGAVHLDKRALSLKGTDHRRHHLPHGRTSPIQLP